MLLLYGVGVRWDCGGGDMVVEWPELWNTIAVVLVGSSITKSLGGADFSFLFFLSKSHKASKPMPTRPTSPPTTPPAIAPAFDELPVVSPDAPPEGVWLRELAVWLGADVGASEEVPIVDCEGRGGALEDGTAAASSAAAFARNWSQPPPEVLAEENFPSIEKPLGSYWPKMSS